MVLTQAQGSNGYAANGSCFLDRSLSFS